MKSGRRSLEVEDMGLSKQKIILLLFVFLLLSGFELVKGNSTIKPVWQKTIDDGVWSLSGADYFVVGTQRNSVYAFSYSGSLLWKKDNLYGVPYYIATSPSGSLIAVGAIKFYNGDWSWSSNDLARLYLFDRNGSILWNFEPEEDTQRITGNVLISADSKYLLFGIWNEISLGYDHHRVYLLNIFTRNFLWYYDIGDNIYDIQATPYFSYILVGSKRGAFLLDKNGKRIWDTTSSSSVEIYPVYTVGIDKSYNLAILGTDSYVYFLNLNDGGVLKKYSANSQTTSIKVSPNGYYIVVGLYNGDVLTFDRFGQLLWKYSSESNADDITISPDNSQVYLYGNDGTVYSFDIKTGNLKWSYYTGDTGHSIMISRNGSYLVVGGASTVFLFEPNVGYLTIYSTPSYAEVYVDGNYIGTTPIGDYKLSTGEHKIVVKKKGYKEFSKTVTIGPGKTIKVEVTLSALPATLEISSEPSGAKVYVDGSYEGTTPLTLELSPGTYTVKLTKEEYENYTTTVTLGAGETKSISATLKPAYGYLSVDSSPSGAGVYVDGSYAGKTPLNGYRISPGEHTVEVRRDGYEVYTKKVTINAGQTASISASLIATPATPETTTTTSERISTHAETTTSQTYSQGESSAGTATGIKTQYIIAALVGLALIGGVAVKARGGKPKPSPEDVKPAPTPPKPVPGFPPELLDKYEPLEFLGEGGFAKVFKVRRKADGKIIALKVSRLDEKAKKFFLKEVKAWRLLDHKNIVKLYNAFDEPLPHLEIEFVNGIQLNGEVIRDLGKYPKPADEEKALHFIRGIADGLKHAHAKQVYHRDLKPQNVLITSDLTPKITDWGLAKVGAVSTTATTTKGLTLLYAAPEQLDDETYGHTDARTDIYQLGLIFYELLTGKLPYQGTSPAVVMAKVINPDVKPKLPSHFNKALAKYDGIFEKLLAKRKEDRYQSVEEFLHDLELMKKLDEERKELEKEIEKTKTTMSMTTDSKELKKLMRQLVEQLSRNALLLAQLNDKAELINALEDLKAFTKEHRSEIENAIRQFELMLRESVPISRSTLDELKILLHKVQREVEG